MRRLPLFAAVAAIVMALSGLGLWIQARGSDSEEDRSPSMATGQASAAFEAMVRDGLAEGEVSAARQWQQFSGVESATGGVPLRTRLAIAETLGGRDTLDILGLEFGSARRASSPRGVILWMVPGRGIMCLVREEQTAVACSSKRKAIRQGLILQIRRTSPSGSDPTFMTIGIAPDWATGISLQAGGAPVTLPIQANAFDFSATRSIKVLQLTH